MKYNGNDVFKPFNAGLYGIDDSDSDRSMQWQESKDAILEAFKREYAQQITDALALAGIKYIGLEYYSPRFYNYSTDSIDLECEIVDAGKCREAVLAKREVIEKGLRANVSYDGYMARTVDTFEEVLEGIEKDDLDIIALTVLLSGIDFTDAQEMMYEVLVYDYPCEKCDRIHSELENESEENAKIIQDCIAKDAKEMMI